MAVLGLVLALVAVGVVSTTAQVDAARAPAAGPLGVSVASLSVNWAGPTTDLAPTFWGTDVRPYVAIGAPQATWWNQTPLSFAVWPGGAVGDGFDYTSGVITNAGGGTYQAPQTTGQFVAWCISVNCHTIFQLPGEIDQPALAASYVSYTEKTLGFHPDYWEVGNEPALWKNFMVPWSQWGTTAGKSISPSVYAQVVQAYITAVRAVDPLARFVGLPGTGIGASQETTWLGATVSLNGPNLSAVAIHVYPAGSGSGSPSLSGFFDSLNGKGSLAVRVPAAQAAIRAACPKCGPLPVFVTESNAGISGGIWDTYMSTFPEVPYMAAQLVQAIQVGVANLDLFSFEGAYPGSLFTGTGTAQPIDTLYSAILAHLGSLVLPSTLSTGEQGAYALASLSSDGSAATLLLANANASTDLTLSLAGSGFPSAGPVDYYAWNSTGSLPRSWIDPGGLPGTLSVPPAGVLLVRVPRAVGPTPASYDVRFNESGLPAGTPWSVVFAGTTLAAANASLTTVAVNGTYSFTLPSLPGWNANPSGGAVVVAGSAVDQAIHFTPVTSPAPEYSVGFDPAGAPPGATWGVRLGNTSQNGSSSLTFSEPNGSYHFSVIAMPPGYGAAPGSGTVVVAGANLTVGVQLSPAPPPPGPHAYPVRFLPKGLPSTAVWTVTLANGSAGSSSGNQSLGFALDNGTFTYTVSVGSGYLPDVPSGTIVVAGAGWSLNVSFAPAALPPAPVPQSPPGAPLGALSNSWLFIALLGILAGGAVYGFERGIGALHQRHPRAGPRTQRTGPTQRPRGR